MTKSMVKLIDEIIIETGGKSTPCEQSILEMIKILAQGIDCVSTNLAIFQNSANK